MAFIYPSTPIWTAKVKYIIRAKTNNISSRIISIEMKVSAPRKFGRPKTYLNEADKRFILGISLITISESFDIIEASTKSKIPEQDVSKK